LVQLWTNWKKWFNRRRPLQSFWLTKIKFYDDVPSNTILKNLKRIFEAIEELKKLDFIDSEEYFTTKRKAGKVLKVLY
jgi:adenylosuccinate synthase